jgi:hypothetical protein
MLSQFNWGHCHFQEWKRARKFFKRLLNCFHLICFRRPRGRPPATRMDLPPLGNSAQARYRRSRHLNNLASRRCRAKRKETAQLEQQELGELQDKHYELRQKSLRLESKVSQLRSLIEQFMPDVAEKYLKFRMIPN